MSRLPPNLKQHMNDQPVTGNRIQPVTNDGVTYKIDSQHLYDDTGKIIGLDWGLEATNADSKVLWKTVYFPQKFNLNLETDVQVSYPIDFLINGDEIVIEHEQGKMFHISFEGILREEK